jgi:hypothetical protein
MKRRSIFNLSAITLLGLALLPSPALPQQKTFKEQLIGTWTFVSSNAKLADGSPQWGENPKGLFIITESGRFSWQVFRSDRPHFASNKRLAATPAELEANNEGMLAYFGTYSVDETGKVVTFVTYGSTFPNSEGEVIKRIITKITADELIYTNLANTSGERVEAKWRKVK